MLGRKATKRLSKHMSHLLLLGSLGKILSDLLRRIIGKLEDLTALAASMLHVTLKNHEHQTVGTLVITDATNNTERLRGENHGRLLNGTKGTDKTLRGVELRILVSEVILNDSGTGVHKNIRTFLDDCKNKREKS